MRNIAKLLTGLCTFSHVLLVFSAGAWASQGASGWVMISTAAIGQAGSGGRFQPDSGSVPPSVDPFSARVETPGARANNAPTAPRGATPADFDNRDERLPLPTTSGSAAMLGAAPGDDAGRWLLEARRALARRDTQSASQWLARASQSRANFQLLGDSPEQVESLIRRHGELTSERARANSRRHARDMAVLLMEQADGLLRYGEKSLARQLAQEANELPATWGPFERTPDNLLNSIDSGESNRFATQTANRPGRNAQFDSSLNDFGGDAPTRGRNNKAEAQRLMGLAQNALNRNDLQSAYALSKQAAGLQVPDSAFTRDETRPWEVQMRVERALNRQGGNVRTAAFAQIEDGASPVARGLYTPETDRTRVRPAGFQGDENPRRFPEASADGAASGRRLFEQGMKALEERDNEAALNHFREAWKYANELDPNTRHVLQDKLSLLQSRQAEPIPQGNPTPLDAARFRQQTVEQKVQQDIFRTRAEAERMREKDPYGSLDRLKQLRDTVERAQLKPDIKRQLMNVVNRSVAEAERYIEDHRAQIENEQRNKQRLQDVTNRREQKVADEQAIAQLVDQFNKLLNEGRFAEAEAVARQARDIAPDLPVVEVLLWKSRFARRIYDNMVLGERREENFLGAMQSVEYSAVPFDDRVPLQFGPVTEWNQLSRRRAELMQELSARRSPEELKVERALQNTRVNARFIKRPLREVLDLLSLEAGVHIHIHEEGLNAEAVTSDTPVTLNLPNGEVRLKTALDLLLKDLHLSYVIQDDVIRVTSQHVHDENVNVVTYYVADLVIPIPNFVPSYEIGLPGAIAAAHNALGYGGYRGPASGSMPLTVAENIDATNPVTNNPHVLANIAANGGHMGTARSKMPKPIGYGPGGLGGGPAADFDPLMELITTTVAPQSWDSVGGTASMAPYVHNLSLVVSQTQEVHRQISDLLEQLRRLQDLQVTIEVRFITLQDDFFERIGVDFDFDVDDNSGRQGDGAGGIIPAPSDDDGPTLIIGNQPDAANPGLSLPTGDLDLSFTQESFSSAVPTFGGFDAATAANFGFAILSDIEVFFLLQAAQGDSRTNVMQAPKVTMFNGQQAFVSDTFQRPFVTSVIPVVGDFAAAHQPVIVVLSEGTSLSVQAVVSADRRFVRLTLVPFFSQIGDVQEFTFQGKKVTITGSNIQDPANGGTVEDGTVAITEGSTVQLPTFAFTSVTTTVSVPDGGTVLLGGVKRLREGRSERGVPILNKLPYINRLFKNVGIGRETQSLMMMVTPRIIIQEEEERNQTGLDSSQL